MSRLREQRGQTAAEYLGMLLVVGAIIAAVSASGIAGTIAERIGVVICKVGSDASCAEPSDQGADEPTEPQRAAPRPLSRSDAFDRRANERGEATVRFASVSKQPLRQPQGRPTSDRLQRQGLGDPRGTDFNGNGIADDQEPDAFSYNNPFRTDQPGTLCQPDFGPTAKPNGLLCGPPDPSPDSSRSPGARALSFLLPDPTAAGTALSAFFGGRWLQGLDEATNAVGGGKAHAVKDAVGEAVDRLRAAVTPARRGTPSARTLRRRSDAWRAKAGDKPSRQLGEALTRQAGGAKPAGQAAHHIVPVGEYARYPAVRRAQAKLQEFRIGPNDLENGVFLPCRRGVCRASAYHPSVHTRRYFLEVSARLNRANSRDDAIDALERIAFELRRDRFPR